MSKLYTVSVNDKRYEGGALCVFIHRRSDIPGVTSSCIGVGASRSQSYFAKGDALASAVAEVRYRRRAGQFKKEHI